MLGNPIFGSSASTFSLLEFKVKRDNSSVPSSKDTMR